MKVVIEDVVRNDSHTGFCARALDECQHFAVLFVSLGNNALSRAPVADVIHVSARCYSTLSCHGENHQGNPLAVFSSAVMGANRGQTPKGAGKVDRGV